MQNQLVVLHHFIVLLVRNLFNYERVAPMCTSHSNPKKAAAVAMATPCCPAPVSAIRRFFADEFGQQSLAHAVVQLVGSGVVQILSFQIDLAVADGP